MEIFFVYGLVFLFFLFTLLFVIAVLPTYPAALSLHEGIKNASAKGQFPVTDKKAVYGTLVVVFIGLLIVAVLSERESH